jgi:hypothetical protein
MAVDVQALKALGMSDREINQLISMDAGNFPSMTATPQPVTNRVAGAYDYTPLYGAGDIIPGTTASIFQNLGIENPNVPVFRLLGSENKGGTNVNESMNFAAQPGQSFRLVNKATGSILGEAATPEGISALVEQSNALSKQLGKKADLSFEQSTGGAYSPIFEDQPNILFDTPMKLIAAGMLAATGAGLLQPGGLGGVGAGASGGGAAGAGTVGATGSGLVPGALQGANALSFAPVATTAIPAATAAGDLVVTALMAKGLTAAQAAALVASGGAAAVLSGASNAGVTPSSTSASNAANTMPPAETFGPEITLTAGKAPTDLVPAGLLAGGGAAAATAANALGSTTAQSPDVTQGMTPEEIQDVTMSGAGGSGLLSKLLSGLGVSDYVTLASLLGGAIAGGGGGGGGGTTAGPYVSPFGAGAGGIGTGRDYRIDPKIVDYERYGFGPEATFFSPDYSRLVSGSSGAPAPTTAGPASAMVNPQYVPLI